MTEIEGQKGEVESRLEQTEQELRQAELQVEEGQQFMQDSVTSAVAVQLANMEAHTQALEQELADSRSLSQEHLQQVQELRCVHRGSCLCTGWPRWQPAQKQSTLVSCC